MRNVICILLCLALTCCRPDTVEIRVSDNVTNRDYMGNGAEWDPYDEVLSWGTDLSEYDWEILFDRVGRMGMSYARCMINSPFLYWNKDTRSYDKTRNIEKISKILQYCKDHGITVIYGEFNPPEPEMKDSQLWVETSVNYLDFLVNEMGFDCIEHFVIFNEPDGSWATTDGDYGLWKKMMRMFDAEMSRYPGLKDKVSLAGPDAVIQWTHPGSGLDTADWLEMAAEELDDIIGLYDVHAYPGQSEVRSGVFAERLRELKELVPEGKRIILGEAGFKYDKPGDEMLQQENLRRADTHPFAGAADSNMMVYDHFYGLDMALLAMDVMNNGYSGMAVWMMDDAAHSVGDTGRKDNMKIWGFWNILGGKAFGMPAEEKIRPWYRAWTMMCRFFPKGCDINSLELPEGVEMRACAAESAGRHTVAVVNWSTEGRKVKIEVPYTFSEAQLYIYDKEEGYHDSEGNLIPALTGISGNSVTVGIPSESLIVITDMP